MDSFVQWLILLLALLIGWLVGIAGGKRDIQRNRSKVPSTHLKHRLQLLFDSYPDQTIDGFVHSLEVTPDTVEIHISIGRHFRRQGEVEKAILIHQNLMARPELPADIADKVTYELARDYKSAGLYDRAEALLLQLSGSRQFKEEGARLLLQVYQFEKEWEKALELALSLDFKRDAKLASRISHYCCEIGDGCARERDFLESRRWYLKGLKYDRDNPRVNYSLARLHVSLEQYPEAIDQLRKLVELSPDYISIALPYFRVCTMKTRSLERYIAYLTDMLEATGQLCILLELANLYVAEKEYDKAISILKAYLHKSGSVKALKLFMQSVQYGENEEEAHRNFAYLKEVADKISLPADEFSCGSCGFVGNQVRWRCPSCNNWGTIRPSIEYVKG